MYLCLLCERGDGGKTKDSTTVLIILSRQTLNSYMIYLFYLYQGLRVVIV
jgi:hypothetical protein